MAIIQEKGMVRAIKGAYRHGGYNVLNLDGDVVIYTEEWCVRCPWNKLPRKALATIVEHLGMIPENETGNPRPSWPGWPPRRRPGGHFRRRPWGRPMCPSPSGDTSYSRR